jgi:ferrochelatase
VKLDSSVGVLLVNTGSSSAPRVPETRAYLRQFLSDPRIIDIAAWKRWLLVNLIILPTRPKKTAHAYAAVWTDRGSPLIVFSEDFRDALAARLDGAHVAIGMAYGEPSIGRAIDELIAKGIDRLLVVPMFPQYASATTGSVLEFVYRHCGEKWNVPHITALPPYFEDPGFLEAWRQVAEPELEAFKPDYVLLSYHGLPERQILKCDPSGSHCLKSPDCCARAVPANRMCYRRHCMESSRRLVERLGLQEGQYKVTFQSRLGREPWLSPATDETIEELAKQGVKRLAVLSPAFTADCLETLEEIGMGGKETFLEHGGEAFHLVPSLNAHPAWVSAMENLLRTL